MNRSLTSDELRHITRILGDQLAVYDTDGETWTWVMEGPMTAPQLRDLVERYDVRVQTASATGCRFTTRALPKPRPKLSLGMILGLI